MAKKILGQALKPFDRMGEGCLLELAEAKEAGRRIFGLYCAFAPEEVVRAAGAIPVSLCGKDEKSIPLAETILPRQLCPLIKSSYGFALSGDCPFFAASDFIVGETTCDGKKKMFELMARLKPTHVMQLPYVQKRPSALAFWRGELERLARRAESFTGIAVTAERLAREIALSDERRRLLRAVVARCRAYPYPMGGRQMLLVMESRNFAVDIAKYNRDLETLIAALDRVRSAGSVVPASAPKILVTGCPMGRGSDRVLKIIEEAGGHVICQEHCNGIKSFDRTVGASDDPMGALARYYLDTPCSCMSPNVGRMALLGRLIETFAVAGVVDLTLDYCHTYNVEARGVEEMVQERFQLPYLHLETGYSPSDSEQLRTRIEAFLEIL